MPHPDENVYPGQVFNGRWKVGRKLGDGNFSLVYEAEDLQATAECAVKILSLSQRNTQGLFEFERDAELLNLLKSCSNVIDILDTGTTKVPMTMEASGQPIELDVSYMVLERADANLTEMLLRRHSISWEDRLKLFRDVAKGVHQMHRRYVVHRDLKGDNTLLKNQGSTVIAKVSDFGRSRNTRQPSPVVASAYEPGRGDLRFAPPEFLWGLGTNEPDEMRLADLFLLGSVLFEFATGQGLTGIVFGDPRGVVLAKQSLDRETRYHDLVNNRTRIQSDFEGAYTLFASEVTPSIRIEAVSLLRRLTAVNPEDREPRHMRTRGDRWDLQWLLKRIDRLGLQLRVAKRHHARFPWKEAKAD